MNVDELYRAVSERITTAVIRHKTDNWPDYFIGLRETVDRVIAKTTEEDLSDDQREALVRQLMEHISELEKCWPKPQAK